MKLKTFNKKYSQMVSFQSNCCFNKCLSGDIYTQQIQNYSRDKKLSDFKVKHRFPQKIQSKISIKKYSSKVNYVKSNVKQKQQKMSLVKQNNRFNQGNFSQIHLSSNYMTLQNNNTPTRDINIQQNKFSKKQIIKSEPMYLYFHKYTPTHTTLATQPTQNVQIIKKVAKNYVNIQKLQPKSYPRVPKVHKDSKNNQISHHRNFSQPILHQNHFNTKDLIHPKYSIIDTLKGSNSSKNNQKFLQNNRKIIQSMIDPESSRQNQKNPENIEINPIQIIQMNRIQIPFENNSCKNVMSINNSMIQQELTSFVLEKNPLRNSKYKLISLTSMLNHQVEDNQSENQQFMIAINNPI